MDTDALVIRPLEASDSLQIAAAFSAIGWSKSARQYDSYLAEQDAGRRHVLVATISNDFAGYITLNWHSSYPLFKAKAIPEVRTSTSFRGTSELVLAQHSWTR